MIESAVTILGDVEVSGRVRTVTLGGTNLPALLCMLAFTPGRAVSNDHLVGALWPDADPVRGRRSLTSLVHQLNQIIDPVLGTDRTVRTVKGVGRTLRVDPSIIDAVVFERRVAEGEAQAVAGRYDTAFDELTQALTLWRGAPFGGLTLPMLVEPAAQLATTHLRAERLLVDSALRTGRAGAVLELLEAKVAASPEDEQAVASLARALYQMGRHDDALAVVGRCVDLLHRRGIDPTPHLRRLDAAIAARTMPSEHTVAPAQHRTNAAPTLVGRHPERAFIGNWFVGATAPRSVGRALVISGEPGIGKTAMLDAWLQGMSDRIVSIRTRCSPEQILPFEAFSPLVARTPTDGPDDLRTRQQLFNRVIGRLRSMADGRAIVLAIDDAHWLTPPSVALLDHLIGTHQVNRLRIVLTLRHHELAANEPLERLLANWSSARHVETLPLGPLSDAEIEELAARHLRSERGRLPTMYRPGDLRALTGGNPLFVIQVAQTGGHGSAVPATVEHLLGRYLDGLPLGVRRGVETAALLGMDGSLERLARCTGRSELDEIEALDAVGDGRLLHVTPIDGRYQFVHELARHTVTEQIPTGRAMRLHLAIADGLESEPQPDAFAIAHHLRLAMPAAAPQRVTDALLSGSRRARELGAFETSRVLAQQALEATDDIAVHADALVLTASAAQSLGEREAAAHHIARAIELALESNSTHVLARALFVKSAVMCFWGHDDLAVRIGQSIDGWLHDDSAGSVDHVALVEVIWALCLDRPGHALPARQALADRALRVARASGNDLALLQALHASQLVGQMLLTDPDSSLAWGHEGLQLADRSENPMMGVLITAQTIAALLRAGRFAEANAMHGQLVQRDPDPTDLAFRWAMRARSASLALVVDDLDRAERLVVQARGIGEPLAGGRPSEEYINHMGVLLLARGSLPGLHHLFGAWFDQLPGPVWHWAVAPGELLDPNEPHAISRRETLEACSGNPVPPHSEWLPELTIAAEYAFRSHDHELGKIVARCIEPFVHQHAVFGVALSLGSMWRPHALALAAAGDDRGAREAMATARLVNAGAGLTLWERLSHLNP